MPRLRPRGRHHRRGLRVGDERGVGAGGQQQPHHLDVGGGAGEQERRRARGVVVSADESRRPLRHAPVRIRAVSQQRLHELQLGLAIRNAAHRIAEAVDRIRDAAFPRAGRPVQRREARHRRRWGRRRAPAGTARAAPGPAPWPRAAACCRQTAWPDRPGAAAGAGVALRRRRTPAASGYSRPRRRRAAAATLSRSPSRAAKCSAVNPFLVRARRSAPASMSSAHDLRVLSAAAHINAVWCCDGSFAFTSAPRRAASAQRRVLPLRAHVMSGVSPVAIGVFGIGAGLQQQLDERRAGVGAGARQRRACGSRWPRSRRRRRGSAGRRSRHRSSARPTGAPSSHRPTGRSRRRAGSSSARTSRRVLAPGRVDQPEVGIGRRARCRGQRRPDQDRRDRDRQCAAPHHFIGHPGLLEPTDRLQRAL